MIYDKQRPLHILLGGGTGNYREYTLILQNCAAWLGIPLMYINQF